MEQNTQVFYGKYEQPESLENDGFFQPREYSDDGYAEEDYDGEGYDENEGAYDGEDDGFNAQEGADGEGLSDDGDYSVYNDELDGTHRFHLAMNVFDTVSVLAGVVVILALTALIVSLVSWFRTDIMHSFVLLQSGIQ